MENKEKENTKELQTTSLPEQKQLTQIEEDIAELESKNLYSILHMTVPMFEEIKKQLDETYQMCKDQHDFYTNDLINNTNIEDSALQTDPTDAAIKYMDLLQSILKTKADLVKHVVSQNGKRKHEPKIKAQNVVTNNSVVFSDNISRRKKIELAQSLMNIKETDTKEIIDTEVIDDGK